MCVCALNHPDDRSSRLPGDVVSVFGYVFMLFQLYVLLTILGFDFFFCYFSGLKTVLCMPLFMITLWAG
jgi:hypothetical protein